jgi:hypothetical protein
VRFLVSWVVCGSCQVASLHFPWRWRTYRETRSPSRRNAPPRMFFGEKYTKKCSFFLLHGGLLHKQGPRRTRLRAAPLPRCCSYNALLTIPCFIFF